MIFGKRRNSILEDIDGWMDKYRWDCQYSLECRTGQRTTVIILQHSNNIRFTYINANRGPFVRTKQVCIGHTCISSPAIFYVYITLSRFRL